MAQVKNLSRRLISFSGNSGQTWHIPPRASIDIEDFELQDSAKVVKLRERRLIDVVRSGKPEIPGEERDRSKRTRLSSGTPGRTPQGD
jgi:hypothetical protein